MNNDIVPGFDDETDENLKIQLERVEDVPDCLLLYLTGHIDTYNSKRFEERVIKAIKVGFIRLIFHFSRFDWVSDCEMGCFIFLAKAVDQKGGNLVLTGAPPKVYEALNLLGFSELLIIKENLHDAITHFANSSSSMFPKVFACPVCNKQLRVSKAGRFRCRECKTILLVDEASSVLVAEKRKYHE